MQLVWEEHVSQVSTSKVGNDNIPLFVDWCWDVAISEVDRRMRTMHRVDAIAVNRARDDLLHRGVIITYAEILHGCTADLPLGPSIMALGRLIVPYSFCYERTQRRKKGKIGVELPGDEIGSCHTEPRRIKKRIMNPISWISTDINLTIKIII